jgi:CDP-glucose 4,6-dehydratase
MADRREGRDSFKNRRVFVTGATGIVGGWLIRALLQEGAEVVVLLRDEPVNSEFFRSGDAARVTRLRGDLSDERLLSRAMVDYDVEVVFHLGAQSQVGTAQLEPLTTLDTNVRGTYTLVEAARRSTVVAAIVIASSDKAYGTSEDLPYRETHPLAGRGIYEASKSAADIIATAYAASYGMPLLIARCGNIYGGGDLNWDRIVPGTIRSLLHGRNPVIRSDGTPRRDYIFVQDAVSAYLLLGASALAGKHLGEAFNFGHGVPVSVGSIVDQLRALTGREDLEAVVRNTAANEIAEQVLDSSKARDVLGWQPQFDLREGLSLTLDWYRELFAS